MTHENYRFRGDAAMSEHDGFLKEAGLKSLAGRAFKGVGRALGSSGMESRGFRMQHGDQVGKMTRSFGRVRQPVTPTPKVELVIPHGTAKSKARVMRGQDRTKDIYTRRYGIGGRR